MGNLSLEPGERYPLHEIATGDEARHWDQCRGVLALVPHRAANGESAWVQAAVPSVNDTGSDGRPSSVRFDFFTSGYSGLIRILRWNDGGSHVIQIYRCRAC